MKTYWLYVTALLLASRHAKVVSLVLPDKEVSCMELTVKRADGMKGCESCDKCPAGMEPFPKCFTKDVWDCGKFIKDCHNCPEGYFKEAEHPNSAPCLPCNSVQCPPYHKIKKECSQTSKRICSDECIDGYHKDKKDECVPLCCKCVSASEKQVKRCQHTPDKHCAPLNSTCKSLMDVTTTPEKAHHGTTHPTQTTTPKEKKTDPDASKPKSPLESLTTLKPSLAPKQHITTTASSTMTKKNASKRIESQKKNKLSSTGLSSPTKQSRLTVRPAEDTTYKDDQTNPDPSAAKDSEPNDKTTSKVRPTSATKPTVKEGQSKDSVPQTHLTKVILAAVAVCVVCLVLTVFVFLGLCYWKTKSGQSSSTKEGKIQEELGRLNNAAPEPDYPALEETLAKTNCVLCGKIADIPLSKVNGIVNKFDDLKRHLNKNDCDKIYRYVFNDNDNYTYISDGSPTADLYQLLSARLEKELTVAAFFEILCIFDKRGVVEKIHEKFHPTANENENHE